MMLVSPRVERFHQGVPRPFLERLVRSLFDNYLDAHDRCRDFAREERANLRPFLRRALIERSVRDIARRFPDEVTAEAVRHEDKGFWFHTRVICSGDVALTQNTVRDPEVVVRNSAFRNCYASPDNQLYLFPDMQADHVPSDSLLYGIILHGRSQDSVRFPGFAQVRFPKPELTGYYPERVDLFEEFGEVVEEKTTGLPGPSAEDLEIEPELLDLENLGSDAEEDSGSNELAG